MLTKILKFLVKIYVDVRFFNNHALTTIIFIFKKYLKGEE